MNFLCKLGLAVLAGAAVILGINKAEEFKAPKTKEESKRGSEEEQSESSNDTYMSGNPNEPDDKHQENNKSNKFMKKVKKVQVTVEVISRVVGCIYRICECISEMFGNRRNYNYYNNCSNNGGSTTIIL